MAKSNRSSAVRRSRAAKGRPAKGKVRRARKVERPPMGSICYVEIPAPDLSRAVEFYRSVFGWKINYTPGVPYAMFNDGLVGGGLDASAKPSTERGVNLVMKVGDIPAKLAQIVASGGEVAREKQDLGDGMGFVAYFRDPSGNLLCLWSKA